MANLNLLLDGALRSGRSGHYPGNECKKPHHQVNSGSDTAMKYLVTQTVGIKIVRHRPKAVLAYLSRYTNRVAISGHRLISLGETGVTFRYKDLSP
jgi:hypothetical protein